MNPNTTLFNTLVKKHNINIVSCNFEKIDNETVLLLNRIINLFVRECDGDIYINTPGTSSKSVSIGITVSKMELQKQLSLVIQPRIISYSFTGFYKNASDLEMTGNIVTNTNVNYMRSIQLLTRMCNDDSTPGMKGEL